MFVFLIFVFLKMSICFCKRDEIVTRQTVWSVWSTHSLGWGPLSWFMDPSWTRVGDLSRQVVQQSFSLPLRQVLSRKHRCVHTSVIGPYIWVWGECILHPPLWFYAWVPAPPFPGCRRLVVTVVEFPPHPKQPAVPQHPTRSHTSSPLGLSLAVDRELCVCTSLD